MGQHLGAEGVYLAGPKSIQRRTPTAPRLIVLLGVTKAVVRTPGFEHGSHTGGAFMMPLNYLRSWYTMEGTHFDAKARPQESCSNLLGPLPLLQALQTHLQSSGFHVSLRAQVRQLDPGQV